MKSKSLEKKLDNQPLISKTISELFKELGSSKNGLSEQKAEEQLQVSGNNELIKKKRISPLIKFLTYFNDPLVILLIIASIVSLITGDLKSAIIIFSLVFLSVIFNFIQEHKSNQAAEKIAKKMSLRSRVLRAGQEQEILTKFVVPGDIVILAAGDIIPADGQIISTDDFFVNESALTGESFPTEKKAGTGREALVFSGTTVVSGYCRCLITSTGQMTEYGQIAQTLSVADEKNAFEVGIKNFGMFAIKSIIVIVLLVFLINAVFQKDIIESLIFSIAIAVGITPELLPMIISVNMAKGSLKMSKKGVIVKRLNAIPDFGSMNILCTDKTGTLTEDRITLVKYLNLSGQEDDTVLRLGYINALFESGIKSVIDGAILAFKNIATQNLKKIDEIPYDFARRRVSIIYKESDKQLMTIKGAPEEIFKICAFYRDKIYNKPLKKEALVNISKQYDELSRQGFRVLAVASKVINDSQADFKVIDEDGAVLCGFLAFLDPPKTGVRETLDFMRQHGVEIKILTGDSPLVTKKICEDIGLEIKGIISGEDLDINSLSDEVLAFKATEANIFARISPIQKAKIIAVLRQKGNVVGYLGDGINDAPALKGADIGISVDNAVDIAKETADIILMKKGLKELMDGVLEGRKVFGNTMKYLMMGLSSSFGNMFSVIGAALFLPFFPMLPTQILLNNLIYDTSQLAIPSDQIDNDYLRRPKRWDIGFIKKFMLVFGPISSVFDLLTFFVMFKVFGLFGSAFQTAWFLESLATQTLVIFIIRTKKLPFIQSFPSKLLFWSALAAVGTGVLFVYSRLGNFFSFTPLPLTVVAAIAGIVICYLLSVELAKHFFYRFLCKED